jgi:hypothetical protein
MTMIPRTARLPGDAYGRTGTFSRVRPSYAHEQVEHVAIIWFTAALAAVLVAGCAPVTQPDLTSVGS